MKNKGFTLIELLAVIIILLIVLAITVPMVSNMIETVRKGAFKATAYSIADSGRFLLADIKDDNRNEEFYFLDGNQYNANEKKLDYTGDGPETGVVILNENNKVVLAIHDGTYCASKSANENKVTVDKKASEECKAYNIINSGDSWEEIAADHDVDLEDLLEENNVTDPSAPTDGVDIIIPVESGSTVGTVGGGSSNPDATYYKTYYSIGYTTYTNPFPTATYEYTIKLGVLPLAINDIKLIRVTSSSVFEDLIDFERYIVKKNMGEVIWPGDENPAEINISQASVFKEHAVKSSNMIVDNVSVTCSVDTCNATLRMTVNNMNNVVPNTVNGNTIAYLPIKFKVEFNGSGDVLESKYAIQTETVNYQKIYPTFDSSVHINQTIGTQKDAKYFSVLTYDTTEYDERPIMTFDVSSLNMSEIAKVELYAFYYNGDIPDRQHTHPIRRVIVPWTEDQKLTNDMMTTTYTTRMTSLNTEANGYGWRSADVTDIVTYWKNNPSENYGLVIDHNRNTPEDGGYWNRMKYYTMESETDFKPHLKITYKTTTWNKKYVMIPVTYDTSVHVSNTIGVADTATYFDVLSFDSPGYDTRGLLTFDVPTTVKYKVTKAELYANYYSSDIPDRQQTHPVRRMITSWTEDQKLTDNMMTSTYTNRMASIDPDYNGYGWRLSDVTDIVNYWIANPSENYGLVVDHNRGLSNEGGWWSKMSYYTTEANNGKAPYLKVYLELK